MQTLTQWTTENGTETLFANLDIDDATQAALLDWYQYRQVCDDDKFGTFFHRRLYAAQWQYNQLLRIQSVEYDPMVAEYMERQVLTKGDTSTTRQGSKSTESQSQADTKTTNTGTTTGHSTTTTHSTGTETPNTTVTSQGTSGENVSENAQGLTGTTPDSAVYPASGFPEDLQWQYASGQTESKGSRDTTGTTSDTTTTTGNTQSEADVTSDTDSSDQTEGQTVGEQSATGTVTESDNGTETGTHNDDTRERYSGRHQAPQDMLDRARDYIMSTNAFIWLIGQLDICFYSFFDEEDD